MLAREAAAPTPAPVAPPLPSDQDASGRSFGPEELALVAEVLDSGTLTSTKGTMVRRFEDAVAGLLGLPAAVAAASGTAAVHAAVAALDPEPGDEVVTTPITDMGALAPLLYQGAIPVFADVDPATGNVTAESVADRLSDRTRAVVVTHLFGNPAPVDEIAAVAAGHGVPVVEDCAQAWLARRQGRLVGTFGLAACFSLQQGKHVTCGEGGVVATSDEALADRARRWVNKAWGYGDEHPDHTFLALNGRLTELQGAVALAQLDRLEAGVANRIAMADLLTEQLAGLEGLEPPTVAPGDTHSYWRYAVMVDPEVVPGGAPALGAALRAWGVPSAPRYIQKPAFRCQVFAEQRTFGDSRWPFTLARPEAVDYRAERFPGTFAALDRVLVLSWSERLTEAHVDHLATALRAALAEVRG
ncbi:MAG TPA: DegT/DnrJ/EryC1/StrS family aminotransferase [Acidimicrobiales bacterium]|jgi:dTDP-4-amino-4,6-dideoxygalactose transaminase